MINPNSSINKTQFHGIYPHAIPEENTDAMEVEKRTFAGSFSFDLNRLDSDQDPKIREMILFKMMSTHSSSANHPQIAFSSPKALLQTLHELSQILFYPVKIEDLLNPETIDNCWKFLEEIENLLVQQIIDLITEDPQGLIEKGLPIECLSYLQHYLEKFTICTYRMHQLTQAVPENELRIPFSPIRYHFADLLSKSEKDNNRILKLSPIAALLEINKQDIENNRMSLKTFLLNDVCKLIVQRLDPKESLKNEDVNVYIEFLNSACFPLLLDNILFQLKYCHNETVIKDMIIDADQETEVVEAIINDIDKIRRLCKHPFFLSYLAQLYEAKAIDFLYSKYLNPNPRLFCCYLDLVYLIDQAHPIKNPFCNLLNGGILRVITEQLDQEIRHQPFPDNLTIILDSSGNHEGIYHWLTKFTVTQSFSLEISHDLIFSKGTKRTKDSSSEQPAQPAAKKRKISHETDDEMMVDNPKEEQEAPVESFETPSNEKEECYRTLRPFPQDFQNFSKFRIIGAPASHWRIEEWTQFMRSVNSETKVIMPLECFCSSSSEIPVEEVNNCPGPSLIVSVSQLPLERQIDYLNSLIDTTVLITVGDQIDLYTAIKLASRLQRPVKVEAIRHDAVKVEERENLDHFVIPSDFNLIAFLEEGLKDLDENEGLSFVKLIAKCYQNDFTVEQIIAFIRFPPLYDYIEEDDKLLPERIAQSIAKLFSSLESCSEGDRLFCFPVMKEDHAVRNVLISEITNYNDQYPLFTKKLISILWHQANSSASSSQTIDSYKSNEDPVNYLWSAIEQCPNLASKFPENLISIFIELILNEKKSDIEPKILSHLLQNKSTKSDLISFVKECNVDSFKALLSIINTKDISRDLSLYPDLVTELVSCCMSIPFPSTDLKVEWSQLFFYLLNRQLLTVEHLSIFKEAGTFSNFITDHLGKIDESQSNKLGKYLNPIATELCIDFFLYHPSEAREKTKAFLTIFLNQGWIPPLDSNLININDAGVLLLPFLCKSLPHLNEPKKKWVAYLLSHLAELNGIEVKEQEEIKSLLEYSVFQKMGSLPKEWTSSIFSKYPIISGYLFDQLLQGGEWIKRCLEFNQFNNLFCELFPCIKSMRHFSNKEVCHYYLVYLTFVNNWLNVNVDQIKKALQLLTIEDLETLLNKLSSNKKGSNTSMHPIAGLIAQFLLQSSQPLKEDLVTLCTRAITHIQTQKWVAGPSMLINNEENRILFEKTLESLVNDSNEFALPSSLVLLLVNKMVSDYRNPKTDNEKLLTYGKSLFRQFFLREGTPAIDQLLVNIIKDQVNQENGIQKFFQDIIQSMLATSQFWQEVRNYPKSRLISTFESLPQLNEESQKSCFQLMFKYQFPFQFSWICNQPTLYLKYFKHVIKRREIIPRERKITLLVKSLPQTDAQLLKELFKQLTPLQPIEFYKLGPRFGGQIGQYLGREITPQERVWCEQLTPYKLDFSHMSLVRPFVVRPALPHINLMDSYLSSILVIFDSINFEDPTCLNYVNPSFLIIDGKKVSPETAKGFISNLIENILHNRRLTAAPDNESERKRAYDQMRPYVTHIAHLFHLLNPLHCSGYFLALAEIGSKCFTQYQELPALYHSMVDQLKFPIMPSWFDWDKIKSASAVSFDRYRFEDPVKYQFLNRDDLVKQLQAIIQGIVKSDLPFATPLKSQEKKFVYFHLLNKIQKILFLAECLPEKQGERILAVIAHFSLGSALELIQQVENLEEKVSTAWLLSYLEQHHIQNGSLIKMAEEMVEAALENRETPFTKDYKKIVTTFYGMQDSQVQEVIGSLTACLEKSENPHQEISRLATKIGTLNRLQQPQTLKDEIIMMLHEERWKIARDLLACQPEQWSNNIHNAKFIEQELEKKNFIYDTVSVLPHSPDPHIDLAVKNALPKIVTQLFSTYHIIFVVEKTKEAFSNPAKFIDWFKVNLPDGKSYDEWAPELFDDNYVIKDEWVIYFLKKADIVTRI